MARANMLIVVIGILACKRVGPVEPVPPPPPGTHAGWYVTTSGTSSGAGTNDAPWDLQTALSGGNGNIRVGDTIWLRQGTYSGQFYSGLSGTAANPIVVRGYPGERATLDGGTGGANRIETLTVNGAYAIYRDFEIMQSSTGRNDPNAGTGTPLRPTGVYVLQNAHDLKFINLVIHDTGHGFYTENTAHNIEIYGCIIFNGGSQSSARSDGHGVYIKGDGIGWKVVRENVIFNQFGFGIHGYAESGQALKNLVFDGNAIFNSGTPSNYDNPNIQLGGTVVADNDSITNNSLYFSPGVTSANGNVRIGYGSTANGFAFVRGNTIVGGTTQTVDVGYWSNLTVQSNLIISTNVVVLQHDPNTKTTQYWSGNTHYHDPAGQAWRFNGTNYTFSGWQAAVGATDAASATLPNALQVVVRPNRYEAGRANIVVYNWTSQSTVDVPVGSILNAGDSYVVMNVQDIFGTPATSGTYQGGGTITIPMGGVTPPQPIGGSFVPLHKTGPAFDVFVLRRS